MGDFGVKVGWEVDDGDRFEGASSVVASSAVR